MTSPMAATEFSMVAETNGVEIKLNYTCNHTCAFCLYGDLKLKENTFETEDVKANIVYMKERFPNMHIINFSGGEPTIHKGLVELLRFAREDCRFEQVGIHSNCIRLADPAFADEVARYIDVAFISIHSTTQEMMNALTFKNYKTEQERKIAGIMNLKERGVALISNTVIVRQNYKHLADIARLCVEDFDVYHSIFCYPYPMGDMVVMYDRDIVPLADVEPYLAEALRIFDRANKLMACNGMPFCNLSDSTLRLYDRILRTQMENFKDTASRLIVGQANRAYIDKKHQFDRFITFGYDVLELSKPFECDSCAWFNLCAGVFEDHVTHGMCRWPRPIVITPKGPSVSAPKQHDEQEVNSNESV